MKQYRITPHNNKHKLQSRKLGDRYWRDVRYNGAMKVFDSKEHGENFIRSIGASNTKIISVRTL